jgi:succinate dehydrogenase / fumarate reductase, iron-sulfur subunit
MRFTLKIWRQKDTASKGKFAVYKIDNISSDTSFLEMIDILNESLVKEGTPPIAFDSDCREGICGSCCLYINGRAHGPKSGVASCQLFMRSFKDGDEITVEPFRAKPFNVIKDLVIDRSSFDRIIQAGGFISNNTGGAPDANTIPVSKHDVDKAFDAGICIGCGACVAACKNASAMLFVSAKVSMLSRLPQGKIERKSRVEGMVNQMNEEGFGACSNTGACSVECPKLIGQEHIAKLNREYLKAKVN